MKGLIEEGSEVIKEDRDPSLKDLTLITAARKVGHYEIPGYESARAIAEALGLDAAVELLQATLDEEGATDKKLTAIANGIALLTSRRRRTACSDASWGHLPIQVFIR